MKTKVCKKCGIEKTLDQFHKASTKRLKNKETRQTNCKKCQHAGIAEKRRDPEYRARFKVYAWRCRLKRTYGIDENQYLELLKKQNGKCAICGEKSAVPKRPYRLHVDHCHETNQIRGLLCGRCNTGIGLFRNRVDLLRRAVSYLETHHGKTSRKGAGKKQNGQSHAGISREQIALGF